MKLRVLPPRANPLPLATVFTVGDTPSVDRHRMTACVNYSACLDFVIYSGWPNFSCRPCPMFVEERPVYVDNVIDLFVRSMERRSSDASSSP